ncbi:DUF3368 domain-containing protein [cf. Phormidesmis sp. LEGE 11477]|uniref:DUF3368 domain-containing protein n=1 Tax=cf. Phormidesmis sp. LEGE 11477 TaxID=1828680 RepID=UPI0018811530|nr:DUF3368 domain-containing protein [cf. Phormidesmis sp. LEGE 11477]MBE9064775.1 DUF3368 domain-containing protein [cf. Phormidesmis sp. LEGE 11477]
MPNSQIIVVDTSPLISLIAAWGNLDRLQVLYKEVVVPFEVKQEVLRGGLSNFGVAEFQAATWLMQERRLTEIKPFLRNSLDLGEASVIQLALNRSIETVCIDEVVGRRVARLNNLAVTGSVGILLKAKRQDPTMSVKVAIANMLNRNIRLSQTVVDSALAQSGES